MKFLQTRRRAPGRPAFSTIFWWTFIRGLVWMFFKILYRIRVVGMEYIPATGPVIYISNHQTHFDPPIVGVLIHDRPFKAMARASLFKNRVFSWVMHSIGAIELERGTADTGAMKAALAELEAGRCVMIFPEGTRSRDGALGKFQRGVTLLIKRSGAKVVPIAIEGAFDVWPIGRDRPRLHGRIAVAAAPPLDADELMKEGPDAAIQRIRREIDDLRLELRTQIRRESGGRYPAPGAGDCAS